MKDEAKLISLLVLSRPAIAKRAMAEPYIVISVTDPGSDPAELPVSPHCRGVLRLEFDDADLRNGQVPRGRTLLNKEDADALLAFIKQYCLEAEEPVRVILCQCEMGRSRSAGIAAALSQILSGDAACFFENYSPNRWVYQMILDRHAQAETQHTGQSDLLYNIHRDLQQPITTLNRTILRMPAIDASTHAAVLIEALPYLREFYGKTIVVKYGGNAMIDDTLKAQVMQDIALLHYVGIRPILVHGGGPEISAMMKQMGHEPTFVGGLRVTDAATMEIVEMVLAGKTNKGIVSLLNKQGAKAVGLSGKDANLILAYKMESDQGDLGYVGEVAKVNAELLTLLSEQGYVPVISSVAGGPDGESYNVNADHVAGHIAAAVSAAKLVVLTDVEGLYADYSDKTTLISEMDVTQAEQMIASGAAERGMIPKLEACITAVEGGVPRAHLIDGRLPHALLIEIFTNAGIGTMLRA